MSAEGNLVVFTRIDDLTAPEVLDRPLIFPCAPMSFPQDYSWSYDDYGTLGMRMHSNPQYPNLSTFNVETLLPDFDWEQPYVLFSVGSDGTTILDFTAKLRAIADTMRPFRFQTGNIARWGQWEPLGRTGASAIAVTMRSLRVEEQAGEVDARYITMSLTEFQYADQAALSLSRLGVWRDPRSRVGGSPGRSSGAVTSHVRGRYTDSAGRQWLGIDDVTMRRRGRDSLRDVTLDYYHTSVARAWQAVVLANGMKGISPSESLADAALVGRIPYKLRIPLLSGSQTAAVTT